MSNYKKASLGTNVEVDDRRNILPVDVFWRIEVDQDQSGSTTRIVWMEDVAYVPILSWNLLSTPKAVEQWVKPLVYYRTKAVLGFPGDESQLLSSERIDFCCRCDTNPESGGDPKSGSARIILGDGAGDERGETRACLEVHRMLAYPSEEITRGRWRLWKSRRRGVFSCKGKASYRA